MTPREVLAQAFRSRSDRGYGRADEVLSDLTDAGYEIVPTALVDAVLAYSVPLLSTSDKGHAAQLALRAYREQVTP